METASSIQHSDLRISISTLPRFNQTRNANALLPPSAPKHKVVLYTVRTTSRSLSNFILFVPSLSWQTIVSCPPES